MPTATLTFTNAGAAGGWTNPASALADDALHADLPPGAANGWLIVSGLAGLDAIPSEAVVFSVTMRVERETGALVSEIAPGAGQRASLDLAITTDGWSPLSAPVRLDYSEAPISASFGGASRAQLASPAFGAMVRRGTGGDENVADTTRRVGQIVVEVTYAAPVVPGTAMAEPRAIGLQRRVVAFQTGPEDITTLPDTLLRASFPDLKPATTYEDIGYAGQLLDGDRVETYEEATGDLAGPAGGPKADYNEMLYYLCSLYGRPVTEVLQAPSAGLQGAYRHEWNIDPRQYVKPGVMVEHTADVNVGEEHRHVFLNSMTLSGTKKTMAISGSVMGRRQTDRTGKPAGARNCVQTLTVSGAPTGGGYILAFEGAGTAQIASNATAAAIQTALQTLPTIGTGNVTVTGAGPFLIEFTGTLGGIEQALLDIRAKGLTGGAMPDVAVAITTQGGWREMEGAPFTGLQATLYLTGDVSLLGTPATKLGELYEYNLAASDRFATKDVVGRTDGTFKGVLPQPWKWTCEMGLQADVDGQALAALARQNGLGARRYLRVEYVAPQMVRVGIPYSLTIDLVGKLRDTGDMKVFEQVKGRGLMFSTEYDAAIWGRSGRIVLVCSQANPMPVQV